MSIHRAAAPLPPERAISKPSLIRVLPPLLLLLLTANIGGVATSAATISPKSGAVITSLPRICAALCTSGLGGPPCNTYGCYKLYIQSVASSIASSVGGVDTIAQHVRKHGHHGPSGPSSSTSAESVITAAPSTSAEVATSPRREVCLLLCGYDLGVPLCGCEKRLAYVPMDVPRVCRMYCRWYGYRLDGCPECVGDVLHGGIVAEWDVEGEDVAGSGKNSTGTVVPASNQSRGKVIDWNQWCKDRCAEGDGGAACNCDILPLKFDV